jgi:hypothetical protein
MQMNRVEFEFATPWSIVSHFSREMLSHTSGADSDVFPASSIHPSTTFHLIIIATIPRLLITSFRISTLLRPQTLRRTYHHTRILGPLKDRLADEFMTGPRVVETVMDSAALVGSVNEGRKGGSQCWGHRGASGMFSLTLFFGIRAHSSSTSSGEYTCELSGCDPRRRRRNRKRYVPSLEVVFVC